jgi:hypothetical protein
VQVGFAAQLDSFLTQVRKQREQLLDLSADVQLQVNYPDAATCWGSTVTTKLPICTSDLVRCVANAAVALWTHLTVQVTVLLKWLGESADADPQAMFSSIAQFARAFDRASALVTKA